MFRPFPLVLAGLATLVALPAAGQSYYRPQMIERPAVEQRYRHGPPRFYLPFMQRRDYGLAQGEEVYPGGAVAVSPSGQRVYYIPAPYEQRQILAHAGRGSPDEVEEPYQRAPRGGVDPRFRRQEVAYSGPQAPGTIVINTSERFLYLVQPGGRAVRYGIGVGREGFSWRGEQRITRMAEWPDWRPPEEMLRRRPDLPRFMPGGPTNPLGARALYLGSTLYRIHGTNEPHTIGQAVSSGCIRMMNEDVTDLYSRVRVGTRVVVL